MTFIRLHGLYLGFWLVLFAAGLVGVYWSVRWAIVDAHDVIAERETRMR